MIRFNDRVHEGKDEATINLVSKLEAETKAEETQYNKQRDESVKLKVTKNAQNFPPLEEPQKQQQPQKEPETDILEPYYGQIMSTENNFTEAHKVYLTQKAHSYKIELEIILNSSKSNVLPGRQYCQNCDPRFKLLSTPEKTRNNLLLQKQL